MKKITVISSSLRKNSNSEILANEFIKGAKENGNEINLINLKDIKMQFCIGCLSCGKTHKCVLKDEVTKKMLDEICNSDVIVFVTPVYYYAVSGQLKTFIDRMNPIYSMDYKFKEEDGMPCIQASDGTYYCNADYAIKASAGSMREGG